MRVSSSRLTWLLVCIASLYGIAGIAAESETAENPQLQDGDRQLQLPLDQTEQLRGEFESELRARRGDDLRDLYTTWIDRIGANGIITTLKRVEPACHGRGHDLGKLLYERIGEIRRALATCEGVCNSACMHGVFRQAMSGVAEDRAGHELEPQALAARVETACATNGEYSIGDCIHGLGHAFMYMANYDVHKAMNYCDQLGAYAKSYYCATGAYMELANNPPANYLIGKSIYFPCDQSPYPAACFRYRFPVSLADFYNAGGSLGQLARGCLALDRPFRLGCFHGVGNGHVQQLMRSPNSLTQICQAGDREDQTVCIEGAIERLARYAGEAAARACASLGDWRQSICEESRQRGLYAMDRSFALYPR